MLKIIARLWQKKCKNPVRTQAHPRTHAHTRTHGSFCGCSFLRTDPRGVVCYLLLLKEFCGTPFLLVLQNPGSLPFISQMKTCVWSRPRKEAPQRRVRIHVKNIFSCPLYSVKVNAYGRVVAFSWLQTDGCMNKTRKPKLPPSFRCNIVTQPVDFAGKI